MIILNLIWLFMIQLILPCIIKWTKRQKNLCKSKKYIIIYKIVSRILIIEYMYLL